jgi:hypothetical protein
MVFSNIFFVADSNEIAVSCCRGSVQVRHRESSGHRPHLLVWELKIFKNLIFFRISLKRKKRGTIFWTQKKRIEKRNPAVYNSL